MAVFQVLHPYFDGQIEKGEVKTTRIPQLSGVYLTFVVNESCQMI